MDSELVKLKEQLKKVKEKYKKKCNMLRKANEKINDMMSRHERSLLWTHARDTYFQILKDMTCHLEKHVYEIRFKYDSKTYTEPQVESFGSRWIAESLILFLAKEKKY